MVNSHIQKGLSPATLPVTPTPVAISPSHYEVGHVVLDSVDFNCHGFTEYLCEERVEYAWMMQLVIGRITGAVSSMQVEYRFLLTVLKYNAQTNEIKTDQIGFGFVGYR